MTSALVTSRPPIVRPLLLACLLAIGAGIVLGVLTEWLIAFGHQLFGPRWAYEQVIVREDGTPLIAAGDQQQNLRTLDGKQPPGDERLRQMSGTYLSLPRPVRPALFRLSWDERIIGWADERRPATLWYLVHDGKLEGSAYFVGFRSVSNACVGYIGARGFSTEEPPAEDRFPMDGRLASQKARQYAVYMGRQPYYGQGARTVHIISANRVMEVDFHETSVRVLIAADQVLSLGTFVRRVGPPGMDDSDQDARHVWYMAIRTSDKIIVYDPGKRTQRSFAIPAELRAATLTFYELRPDQALLHVVHYVAGDTRNVLYWIDPAGEIARREEVVLPSSAPLYRPRGQAWVVAAVASPPLAAAVGVPFAASDLERGPITFAHYYRRGLALAWLPLTLDMLLGVAMAWLCCRRQRRYAQPWTACWAVFVFLGGVPGLLAYLWHRRWPTLQPCPACGTCVPRDRDGCARCDTEFPAPAPKGIEVFAA